MSTKPNMRKNSAICKTLVSVSMMAITRRCVGAFAFVVIAIGMQCVPSAITAQSVNSATSPVPVPGKQEPASAAPSNLQEGKFHFIVTQGKDVKVCKAYARRLNNTFFSQLPVCDRPETRDDHGFAYLNRKLLGQVRSNYFYSIVEPFLANAEVLNDREGTVGEPSGTSLPIPIFRGADTGASWTYDPPVDIENNGTFDKLLVWNIENTANPTCGIPDPRGGAGGGGQQLVVLSNDERTIDREKTLEIFGRQGTPMRAFAVAGRPGTYVQKPEFRPIGATESVFEYEGLFYFDTFYDDSGLGDYLGERKKDKKLNDTLAVFIRQNHATREVCELYLTNSRNFYDLSQF
jgi:hypothetical protein